MIFEESDLLYFLTELLTASLMYQSWDEILYLERLQRGLLLAVLCAKAMSSPLQNLNQMVSNNLIHQTLPKATMPCVVDFCCDCFGSSSFKFRRKFLERLLAGYFILSFYLSTFSFSRNLLLSKSLNYSEPVNGIRVHFWESILALSFPLISDPDKIDLILLAFLNQFTKNNFESITCASISK